MNPDARSVFSCSTSALESLFTRAGPAATTNRTFRHYNVRIRQNEPRKSSFTCTLNVTIVVSDTFDVFDVDCKQYNRTALDKFLNSTKNGDVDGTCKRSLTVKPMR